MTYFIFTVIGFLIGCLIFHLTIKISHKPSGTFIIDFSDPMKDVCRFEMEESLDSIYQKKQIVLNVKTFDKIS